MNQNPLISFRQTARTGNEQGFVLVVCLMMLVILTFLGMIALNNTTTELKVSGNENLAKSAFYRADSGVFTVPKMLRETVSDRAAPAAPMLTLIGPDATDPFDLTKDVALSDTDFTNIILGYTANTKARVDFTLGNQPVRVAVTNQGSHENAGGSTEFGMSYDGAAKQSYHLLYAFESRGYAPNNAEAVVEATYKLMPGTAGGL